jgi:hypothetical protein
MVPISAAVLGDLSDNEALSSDDANDAPFDIGAEGEDDAALLAIVQPRQRENGAASDRGTSGGSVDRSDRARRRAQREGRTLESLDDEDAAEDSDGGSDLRVCLVFLCSSCLRQCLV